jgi:uncharacterized protein (TIGR00730 family)
MKRIAIYCGSSSGFSGIYLKFAYNLGKYLAENNIELVYGGAQVGLMGAVANGVLENGGSAIGIIPSFLQTKEIAHANLTELIVVETMHERKTKMCDLCDAVIAIPGGFGTMDEVFEMLTWAQLGLHKKPIGLLNHNQFYDALIGQTQKMVDEGFLSQVNKDMLLMSDTIEVLMQKMKNYIAPEVPKWLKSSVEV